MAGTTGTRHDEHTTYDARYDSCAGCGFDDNGIRTGCEYADECNNTALWSDHDDVQADDQAALVAETETNRAAAAPAPAFTTDRFGSVWVEDVHGCTREIGAIHRTGRSYKVVMAGASIAARVPTYAEAEEIARTWQPTDAASVQILESIRTRRAQVAQ